MTISCELKISWLFPALMSIFTVWQSSFVCKFLINCVLCLDLWPCWLSFLWSYLCTVCLYDGRHSLRQNGWACCCYWWCCCWLLLTCNCTSIWPNFNQWARWKGKCTHNNTRRKYIMSPIRLVFFVNSLYACKEWIRGQKWTAHALYTSGLFFKVVHSSLMASCKSFHWYRHWPL